MYGHKLDGLIEDEALKASRAPDMEDDKDEFLLSIAISLKRIADQMEAQSHTVGNPQSTG